MRGARSWWRPTRTAVLAAVLVVVAVAAVVDTTFIGPGQAAAGGAAGPFDPAKYAADQFPRLTEEIGRRATELSVLAPALDADLAAAGKRYGQDLGAGSFAFAVKATGTVKTVDENFAVLTVRGVPASDVVRIPLGAALNGSPIRDCTGTLRFGDFPDQTAYQEVSNQFRQLAQRQVIAKADLTAAVGKTVSVVGAIGSGGPKRTYSVNPVSITVTT